MSLSGEVEKLALLMRDRAVLALSGAGISTESGIPDYRGPGSAARRTRPITYREFVGSPAARARYWARSAVGWPLVASVRPNAGHEALARLEGAEALIGIITQNVDGLHQAAGSRRVLELHGSLADVVCLDCGAREGRQPVQERLLSFNPDWASGPFVSAQAEPDGDARIEPPLDGSFRIPDCLRCGGMLKPDVTFFGENVPRTRVEQAFAMLEQSDVLLVVGSSLAVYSGYRFVIKAVEDGKPVGIINRGLTRGDASAAVRVDAALGEVLPLLARALADVGRS